MDHTAAVAAKPTYPLTPTTTPKDPTWVDSASGGYYDDGLGHYSNNAGASWDYTPPATTPTTWNLPTDLASLPKDTLPTTPQPFVPSYDLPAEPQFSPWDSTPGSMVGFGETFRPDWGVMTTPGAEVPAHLRGSFADPNVDGPDLSFGEQIKGGLGSAGSALNTLASGNKFVRELTGGHVDPSTLPYNLDKLTDVALSPVTWATAGAGQGFRGAGVLGSVAKGPFAKRLAGEVAVGTGGLVGSEKAAEQAAEYTDNPYLIGGAGVLGAVGSGIGVLGAAKAAKRAPGAVKAADRALTELDARIMEPAGSFGGQATAEPMVFSKGLKKGAPERTVIPDSRFDIGMRERDADRLYSDLAAQRDAAQMAGNSNLIDSIEAKMDAVGKSPAPLANERLWFHSTRDMTYDLPDPDLAVGTQTGITQGPGIYMAADPKKSAGNYGPRTFVAEFDGTTLDLTKVTTAAEPVFPGGPSWDDVRLKMIADAKARGYFGTVTSLENAFDPKNLDRAGYATRADEAKWFADGTANGYVYRQALMEAMPYPPEDLLGRFKALARKPSERTMAPGTEALAYINNTLADNGVDALFHHSPRADGDVLIVLNGEKARTVADVKNAPDAVKQGATLKDIKRGAATQIVNSAKQRAIPIRQISPESVEFPGQPVGKLNRGADGRWRFEDAKTGQSYASPQEVQSVLRELQDNAWPRKDTSVRTFGSRVNDETGALDMGAVVERFGEAGKRAARIFADAAEKEGRPTSGGIFDMLAPTERAGTGLVRRYEGAVGTAGLDLRKDLDIGNRLLREAKQPGNWDGTRFVAKRTPEMEQLFKALHGEGAPPASLQKVYDAIKPMVEKESAATIDFDKAFVPRDDYFYRGWKEVPVGKAQNAGTTKGQFGAKPGFMKPRSDQSFSDILNTVYTKPDGSQVKLEPISWNPFEMAAIRKTAGEQFRAQSDLLAGLKETGMAVSADVAPDGWRVPRVGPAFEGKPFAFTPTAKDTGPMSRLADEGAAAVGYTKRIAVPDKVANDIESIFGRQPSFGALDSVLSFGQKAKQSKLLLSLFQQMDFGARTLGALNAGVIDELAETVGKAARLQPGPAASHLVAAGRKFLAIPKDLAELPLANVSGAAQRRLRAGILDAKPIYKERPGITLKGVSEAGGKFGTDISLVTRDIMADIKKGPKPAYLTTGAVGRRIRMVNAASQRGLFDGWYVQSQSTALKKTILPRIMRQHPDWTDAQIMAAGADEVNKMFSTLGEYQTAIKNPAVKKLARGLIFSTNETEALLRGAASTVVGPNKRLWTEFYLGTFLGLAAIAETVHYATTGEHLPVERLNPIDTDNDFGPLPVGYRTNFLAPDIPVKGRNNTKLTLDTVMQMDTIFRLLDPKAFVESRENVLPRAATNQITGKDFFGRPLKGPKDRIAQAAIDLAEPIGMGNLRAATGFGPDSESRIGTAGALLQTAGANVRAENNAALKDRLAVEWAKSTGATKNDGSPITGWRDLDPLQRPQALESNPDIQRELEQRGEDAAKQGSEYGILAAKRKADAEAIRADNVRIQQEIDAKYIRPGEAIPIPGKGSAWRAEYNDHMYAIARQYDAKETIDPFTGKPYGSDMDKAIEAYYTAFDAARKGTKTDYDQMDKWRVDHPAEAALVDKYLAGKNNTDMTEVVTAKKAAAKAVESSGFFALKDDAWAKIQAAKMPGTAGYEDYYAWREAMQTKVAGQLEAAGESKEYAMEEAARLVAKMDPAKIQSDILKVTTSKWVVAHPAEAVTAWRWGYFNPGKENGQEAFLNDWIKKHPEYR